MKKRLFSLLLVLSLVLGLTAQSVLAAEEDPAPSAEDTVPENDADPEAGDAEREYYTITAEGDGNASVYPVDEDAEDGEARTEFAPGEEITLHVEGNAGYLVDSISVTEAESGDPVDLSGEYGTVFTMPADDVVVRYTTLETAEETLTLGVSGCGTAALTASDAWGNSITPDAGTMTVTSGWTVTGTAVPDEGHTFKGWYEGTYSDGAVTGYEEPALSADAEFSFVSGEGPSVLCAVFTENTELLETNSCSHSWTETTQKATLTADGRVYRRCSLCGEEETLSTIPKPSRIALEKTSYTYDGAPWNPKVIVESAEGTIASRNYYVTYSDNVNAGTATATVTFQGQYEGSKNLTFKINPASIKNVMVTGIVNKRYTGKALTQSPVVYFSFEDDFYQEYLKVNQDYTLSYKNNTNVGTATVTIKGKGNYKDSVTRKFQIVSAAVWERLAGVSGTGALGTQAKITGKFTKSEYAILATNADFKDALAGVALAGTINAPVFTNPKNTLSPLVKSELKRLGVKVVLVLGSSSDISDAVVDEIEAMPTVSTAWRITEDDATASQKAAYTAYGTLELSYEFYGKPSNTVIIATQKSFKDALSISPYAYATRSPIIYVEKDLTLSDYALDMIKSCGFTQAIIVGGPVAIPDAVKTQLTKNTKVTKICRLGGAGCYNTSRIIAEWEMGKLANGTNSKTGSLYKYAQVQFQPSAKLGINNVGISRGDVWKDAIAGSALCGMNKAVLLLADGTNSKNTAIVKTYKKNIAKAYVFGGTQAVPAKVYNQFVAAAK